MHSPPQKEKYRGRRNDKTSNEPDPDHSPVLDDAEQVEGASPLSRLMRELCSGGSGMGSMDD
jgi:hypothetical protein